MFCPRPNGRPWRSTAPAAACAVLLLVVVSSASLGASPARAPAPAHISGVRAPSGHARETPRPLVGGVTGTFYQNQTHLAPYTSGLSNAYCQWYGTTLAYCYPDSASPNVLTLANGDLGLGFELATTTSATTCKSAAANQLSRLAFATSSNGGVSFGTAQLIGSVGNTTCPFYQEIEPSFAVQSNGTIDGVYVGANTLVLSSTYPGSVDAYTARSADALVLVRSFDNGTKFTGGTLLLPKAVGEQNIARPAIATFGRTLYVAYENISNGSSVLPGTSASHPIAVDLIESTDGGTTWQGPYALPGLNASQGRTAFSPSIAVGPTGTVAIAYATNRSCVAFCRLGGLYQISGEQIVVATSSSNGTGGFSLHAIDRVAEPTEYGYSTSEGPYLTQLFQYGPTTSVAYDERSGNLTVAFSGAYNVSADLPYAYDYDYVHSGVYAATSADGGASWAVTRLGAPMVYSPSTYSESYFNPGVGVARGQVYVTFTYLNESAGTGGCGVSASGGLPSTYSQWIARSPDGSHFGPAIEIDNEPNTGGYNSLYGGWYGSVGFTSGGTPVVGYSIPTGFFYRYTGSAYLYLYAENVSVAVPYQGNTTTLSFAIHGLSAGANWSFSIDGNRFSTTLATLNVTNVPAGPGLLILPEIPSVALGYETIRMALGGGMEHFTTPATVPIDVETFVGYTMSPEPNDFQYAQFLLYSDSGAMTYDFSYYWEYYSYGGYSYYYAGGCPFPWYLPQGMDFTWDSTYGSTSGAYEYTSTYVGYWTGTGAGSYTGAGPNATIRVGSQPINETFWMLAAGTYGIAFDAPALPANSTYSFGFNGSTHSAAGGHALTVRGVDSGPHAVSPISATSATPGWQYFGTSPFQPVLVPVESQVNLSFAFVDLASSSGTVSFRASGLTAGTVWQLAFNGTTYSSATPWINVTSRTGVFPVEGFPTTAQNGSAGYVPDGVGPTERVSPGHTYAVNFTSAYELTSLAGTGGRIVSGGGSRWLAPGTKVQLTAQPSSGFGWLGWTGSGPGAYSGASLQANVTVDGPVVETANFYPLSPSRFNVTVTESGVPNGTTWSVFLDGVGYSSDTSTLTVPGLYSCASGSVGRYAVRVPTSYVNASLNFTRFVASGYPGSVCGGSGISVQFTPEYLVALSATTGGSVTVAGGIGAGLASAWFAPADAGSITATASAGYRFVGWSGVGPGSYSGPAVSRLIYPAGPIQEYASFAPLGPRPAPTLTLTLDRLTAFEANTTWTARVDGTNYSSMNATLTVLGLRAGPHTLSMGDAVAPDGRAEYVPLSPGPSPVHLLANATIAVAYGTSYLVTVRAVGAGAVAPNNTPAFDPAGVEIALNATPAPGSAFLGWTGTGPGNYTGPIAAAGVFVNGSIVEVATFGPAPPAVQNAGAVWSSPPLLGAMALLGLIVGGTLGYMVLRRIRPSGEPETAPESVEDSVPDPEGPAVATPVEELPEEEFPC